VVRGLPRASVGYSYDNALAEMINGLFDKVLRLRLIDNGR